MNKEIKDIAMWEETDSELAKYNIQLLSNELRISQNNEETYRLEMQDITKILGLDEHTIFDDVKDYVTNLQEENERLNNQYDLMENSLDEKQEVIDKAIEYIERNCLEFNVKYACQGLNNDKVDVLLDILRGEDNESK